MIMLSDDPLYLKCLQLSSEGGKRFGFGAILFDREGRLAGLGRNRQRSPSDVFRMPGQGLHAEAAAINDALLNGNDPAGGTIYVAGYFKRGGRLYLPEEPMFSCVYCPPIMEKYGISRLAVPVENAGYSRWSFISLGEAATLAERFRGRAFEERVKVGMSERTLGELAIGAYSEVPVIS
jgi:hypothetical protein